MRMILIILSAHVDDMCCGGISTGYRDAIAPLRKTSPVRKWRVHSGDVQAAFLKGVELDEPVYAELPRVAGTDTGTGQDDFVLMMLKRLL